MIIVGRGFADRGKSPLTRHSERSEESLCGLNSRKEGFLAALGMKI